MTEESYEEQNQLKEKYEKASSELAEVIKRKSPYELWKSVIPIF